MATSFNERFDQHGTWRRDLTEQKLGALTQYLLPMTTPDGFGVVMNAQSD